MFLPDAGALHREGTGRVRLMAADGRVTPRPVLDVAVAFSGERGLAGLTLSPDFVRDRALYIWYTASPTGEDTHDREAEGVAGVFVERYRLEGDSIAAGPGERILTLRRARPIHNVATSASPDGRLYVSLGELNQDASLNAQRPDVPMGSLLRYNATDRSRWTILSESRTRGVYGLRNPFGSRSTPPDGAVGSPTTVPRVTTVCCNGGR